MFSRNNSSLPQGAKLGPLLFVFLINSLLADWQGRIRYVDDTTLELSRLYRDVLKISLLPKIVDGMSITMLLIVEWN